MGPAWDNAKDGIMSEEDYPYERKVPPNHIYHENYKYFRTRENIAGRGMPLQQQPSCGKRHWP